MTFAQYKEIVEQYGHFSVLLDDNRTSVGLSEKKCRQVFEKFLHSLITICKETYIYNSKMHSPPPKTSLPVVLSTTKNRVKVDASKILLKEHLAYWYWALQRQCIVFILEPENLPANSFAKHVWDPNVIANLGVIVNQPAIALAKREISKGYTCCIISRDAYNNNLTIFASRYELAKLYETFILNCHFQLTDLERDLKPLRHAQRRAAR